MVAAPVPTEVLDVVKVESGSHEATAAKLHPLFFFASHSLVENC